MVQQHSQLQCCSYTIFSGKTKWISKVQKIKIYFHNFLYLLQDYIDCTEKYMIFISFADIIDRNRPILVVLKPVHFPSLSREDWKFLTMVKVFTLTAEVEVAT